MNFTPLTQARRNERGDLKATSSGVLPDQFTPYSSTAYTKEEQSPLSIAVNTSKALNKSLTTTISVYTRDGHFETHRLYHDYYGTLASSKVRVTEKALLEQHNRVLKELQANWDEFLKNLLTHYESKS